MGQPLPIIRFEYTGASCAANRNTQGDQSSCLDNNGGPSLANGQDVTISCRDSSSNTSYFSGVVSLNESLPIAGLAPGSFLPDSLSCDIFNTEGSVLLQSVTIDTSGSVDLFLKDSYGSLELNACSDSTGLMSDCFVNVEYTYSLTNVGDTDMNVTELDRTRAGQDVSLLDQLPETFLRPGESSFVTESELIDICIDGVFETTITAAADPPNGVPCLDDDTYVFDIDVTCRVDVVTTCIDENGIECQTITPASGICSDGDDITATRFIYRGGPCETSANDQPGFACMDTDAGPPPAIGFAVIACKDGSHGSSESFFTGTVPSGRTLTLTNNGNTLPSSTICTISNVMGSLLQTFTFDPSGRSEFFLNDVYGSFQLDSCTDNTGDTLDCDLDVFYTYELTNVGTNNMNITRLERDLNGDTTNVLSLVQDTMLSPGRRRSPPRLLLSTRAWTIPTVCRSTSKPTPQKAYHAETKTSSRSTWA